MVNTNYILTTRPENELYHWKYASKKKVNGKWRYQYDSKKESKGQEDHKYIARVLNPAGSKNKYTYFYTMEEYQVYFKRQPIKIGSKPKDGFSPELKKFITNKLDVVKQQSQKAFERFSKINPSSMSDDEHQKVINPLYEYSEFAGDERYTENCASCAVAYDLRKRGYDVVAAPVYDVDSMSDDDPKTPSVYNILNNWYKPKPDSIRTDVGVSNGGDPVDKVEQRIDYWLSTLPDGARGIFSVSWAVNKSAHAMSWEKENGVAVFRDCQSNELINLTEVLERADYASMIRTDNVEPTEVLLSKVMDGPEARKQAKIKMADIEATIKPYVAKLDVLEEKMCLTTDMDELEKWLEEASKIEEQIKNLIKKKL